MTADIRMPDLGLEFHGRRSEWIFSRYSDIDLVGATFIRGARRTRKRASEVGNVTVAANRFRRDLRAGICADIRDFLRDTAGPVGSHGIEGEVNQVTGGMKFR